MLNKMPRVACVALGSAFLFAGCASAIKKKCESTNWFDYGESVAKQGQRPASDSFVLQCEKAEAQIDSAALSQGFKKGLDEYCTPDFAYRLGKQGEFLSGDMCSGGMEIQMKPRHEAGVREYCAATNGEAAGAAGKKYNQICPKDLEAAFLPEFNRGRKKYLVGLITRKQGEIDDVERQIADLERHKAELRQDIQRLDLDRSRLQGPTLAGASNAPQGAQQNGRDQELQNLTNEIQRKQWDIDADDRKIQQKRGEEDKLRGELREAQGELPTL
jgi:hypothetical protein